MSRIGLAFRSFFSLLFHGTLSEPVITELGLNRAAGSQAVARTPAVQAVPPQLRISDGALQILGILQRDSRLIDFLMEDISPYTDDQIGAAVRQMHDQAREALSRYVKLEPVIDGVEGTFTKPSVGDPHAVKFVGNVPAGTPSGGTLRHKGWRAAKVDLPPLPKQDTALIAPAEIEVE